MARKIFVSSDMGIDDRLASVADSNPMNALIWPWLLTIFDDWGRAEASPRRIKGAAFGSIDAITAEIIAGAIDAFIEAELIEAYDVQGKRYIAVPAEKWFDYQSHIHTGKRTDDSRSKCPSPPSWYIWISKGTDTTSQERVQNRDNIEGSAKSRENARECAENRASVTPPPPPSPSPSVTVTVTPPPTAREGGGSLPFDDFSVVEGMSPSDLLAWFESSDVGTAWQDYLNGQLSIARGTVVSRAAYLRPVILRILRGEEKPPGRASPSRASPSSKMRRMTEAEADAAIDASLADLTDRYGGDRNGKI